MQQKQQRAIAYPWQSRSEAARKTKSIRLSLHLLLDLLPLHPEGRVGEHVVVFLIGQLVVGERVAEADVLDVLPLDQHVGLADRVALGVELLAAQHQPGRGVHPHQVFLRYAQHAAGARGGVVEAAHDAALGEGLVVFDENEIHHQPDHFTRGEVLSGGFIGELRELADQLLEHQPHLGIAHRFRVKVDLGEALAHHVKQPGLVELVHLQMELKALEDVAYCRRERLDVAAQVLADVVLIAHQPLHAQG